MVRNTYALVARWGTPSGGRSRMELVSDVGSVAQLRDAAACLLRDVQSHDYANTDRAFVTWYKDSGRAFNGAGRAPKEFHGPALGAGPGLLVEGGE